MKTISVTTSRLVTTSIIRTFEIDVDADFTGFSEEEIDIILNDEIYEINDNPNYISLDVEYDRDTLTNIDDRPIGNICVSDSDGKNIQYHINYD